MRMLGEAKQHVSAPLPCPCPVLHHPKIQPQDFIAVYLVRRVVITGLQ